ncbi:MAG TPA: hypothetical protein VLF94_01975, partial [Chlamydiales bacterium]|nr:hypothetical protein [Chlamydiales bacterium]
NYVSSHPGKVALSAAALVAAGYGLYVGYGVYAAAAAAARLDAITNKLAGQCPVPRNGATKLDDVLNYFELNGCSNCTQTELNKLFSKAK